MAVLDPALAASIRLLLDQSAEELPDAAILDPLIGGHAERTALRWAGDPDYAYLPDRRRDLIRAAVAYLTAAVLVEAQGATAALTAERFGDEYSYTRAEGGADVATRVARLTALARRAIAAFRGGGHGDPAAQLFRLAAGRRGA